jgi:hypothetical protein
MRVYLIYSKLVFCKKKKTLKKINRLKKKKTVHVNSAIHWIVCLSQVETLVQKQYFTAFKKSWSCRI